MSSLFIDHVWKIYQGEKANEEVIGVRDATFDCRDGGFLAILGPSGSGKSSLLRMIAGIEDVTRGRILFGDHVVNDVSPQDRNVALAFESYALYPVMTIYDNLAFPLKARGMRSSEIHKQVQHIAMLFDLVDVLYLKPGSLSGGHQQRVSLARALVRDANITLLDEPISHMDQEVRTEMRARVLHFHRERKKTTIYVTHDQEDAIALCDRMVIINFSEISQVGTVDEIWNYPDNRFVASFVGEPKMNFIDARIGAPNSLNIAKKDGRYTLAIPGTIDAKHVNRDISLGIRPQEMGISPVKKENAQIPGTVELIEFQGSHAIVTVVLKDAKNTEVRIVVKDTVKLRNGELVWPEYNFEKLHLFSKEDEKAIRIGRPS